MRAPAPRAACVASQAPRGYNIGTRLVDEYFAKTGAVRAIPRAAQRAQAVSFGAAQGRCADFREAAESVAKVALKMFLGVGASTSGWNAEGSACTLVLDDNPLADFVELPEQYRRVNVVPFSRSADSARFCAAAVCPTATCCAA